MNVCVYIYIYIYIDGWMDGWIDRWSLSRLRKYFTIILISVLAMEERLCTHTHIHTH